MEGVASADGTPGQVMYSAQKSKYEVEVEFPFRKLRQIKTLAEVCFLLWNPWLK